MKKLSLLASIFLFFSFTNYKGKKNYPRVKNAYSEKWENLKSLLASKGIDDSDLEIYLRAFKMEGKFEVWGKSRNKKDSKFVLIKTYDICKSSGVLGPKRKEGDKQVPEGFYNITTYNPTSAYYLGMLVNYPNKSDLIRSDKTRPGGSIMIHGDCVTIGCIPLTDEYIKEVYILCLESSKNGENVRVDIFPCHFDEKNEKIISKFPKETQSFWNEIKPAYYKFNKEKTLCHFKVLNDGSYSID